MLNIYGENKIDLQHTDLLSIRPIRAWNQSMRFILDPYSSNADLAIVIILFGTKWTPTWLDLILANGNINNNLFLWYYIIVGYHID